jgi:hypothetical protein
MSEYERLMSKATACRERAKKERGLLLSFYLSAAAGYERRAMRLTIGDLTC